MHRGEGEGSTNQEPLSVLPKTVFVDSERQHANTIKAKRKAPLTPASARDLRRLQRALAKIIPLAFCF